jgi:endonuclease YncB( thermonuclease family)
MNTSEGIMAQNKFFLHRYRWWILAISSVGAFSIITLLVFLLVIVEDNTSLNVTPAQYSTAILVTQEVFIDDPEPTQEIILAAQLPTENQVIETNQRQLAYVERVIDGDSIEVIIDGELYQLRYIGVDASELGMPLSKEATEANKRLVESQIVELESDITDMDKYGRLLRYVYLPDGKMVNAELVGLGLAAAYAYPPDIKNQEIINSKEQLAKNAELGLWAPPETPTLEINPEPGYNLQIDPACSQFNAPGNDNDNKNEEYVCIVNSGSGAIDLLGWSIHDEYGWTFQFPLFNLEGNSMLRVFTGCGTDSSQELYWCKDETAVWNNDGDCVYLINSEGIEAAKYCYK